MAKNALQIGWRARGTAALREMGYEVDVVYSGCQYDWGLDYPELARKKIFCENYYNVESLFFSLARANDCKGDYDLVIGFDEFSLIPASLIANELGIEFYSPSLITRMRDKSVQKGLLRDAGIPCARNTIIEDVRHFPEDFGFDHLPGVLKPVSGAGTFSTFFVENPVALSKAISAVQDAPVRTFLLEEAVDGREHHIDGWVWNGRMAFQQISIYVKNVIEIQSGYSLTSMVVPAQSHAELYSETAEFLEGVFARLGYDRGVFHVEAFRANDGWIFSEAGMRVGGGAISHQIKHDYGVDLFRIAAECASGIEPKMPANVPGTGRVTGFTFLPGVPGICRGLPAEKDVLARPGVVDVEIEVVIGQSMGEMIRASFIRAGLVVMEGSSEKEFLSRCEEVRGWFAKQVVVEKEG